MKRALLSTCFAVCCLPALIATAQQPAGTPTPGEPAINEPLSSEMWFYREQQRRHDDPAQAVRRKAEQRAAERMARIAAMKWYGYSNSRPTVTPTPFGIPYSAGWVGNTANQSNWSSYPQAVVVPYDYQR